ncbi:MAG TPA: hypothetical protein VK817_17590 [Trebonia sp.]|nr:hypothetical protein [Trebonia sp.]
MQTADAEHKAEAAEHKAEIAELRAETETVKAQLAQEISDKLRLQQEINELKAEREAWPEKQPVPDRSPDSGEEPEPSAKSDVARHTAHPDTPLADDDADQASSRLVRGPNGAYAEAAHARFSPESMEAGKAALGLAGSLGIVPPGLSLLVDGDAARRAVKDMPPEDQYRAVHLADTAVTAFGTLPPGIAVFAIAASALAPAMHARIRNVIRRMRERH